MGDISVFQAFGKGESTAQMKAGTNCVIYTRVSSKEQADKNLSLETQRKACDDYARKHNYVVLANFGGTYESAQTDERKEFTSMIAYVKRCREKVSYIIVYSLERFSRNDNSIWLSGQLRKLGIEIISVTQPIDTSNPAGKMQQKMLFLFGEFDNELRKQKCMAGIKEMLMRGDWPTKPPLGFDTVKVNGKRRIVINSKGKLLRQAFIWKAEEGIAVTAIRDRLKERGLKVDHRRLSEIFRNPFYCGLIAHRMLEGEVVPGNHEELVSKKLFLRVNGVMDKNTHGYTIQEENDAIPLKRFLLCDSCGKPMRGYIVKKKGLYYYKCCTIGCCNNKSAKWLNAYFGNILEYFKLDITPDMTMLIRDQAIATFNKFTKGNEDEFKLLYDKKKELDKKIERLEDRFINEEIDKDLYYRYIEKFKSEKDEIEQQIAKASEKVSNLDEVIDLTMEYASKLPAKWHSSDYITKQSIQRLIFPEGISYNRKTDKCRTTRINFAFSYVAYLQQVMGKKERGIPELNLDYASFADLVARTGIEPVSA